MTHYEKLGVSQNATLEEIKSAYKYLIKKYHPDVYQGDKSFAEKMTKEINVAYDILSDSKKKAEYDEEINPSPSYDYTPPKYDTPPSTYNDYRKSYYTDYNYNYRYTNYHRNKTPNSSYSENSPLENKIISIFDSNKLVVIFLILIIYTVILIFTFCQFYAFKNNKYSGTITNLQEVEEESEKENVTNNITQDSTDYIKKTFPKNYDDFNINDFVSDADLYSIYSQYYYSEFENFDEFKEAISKELYNYYTKLYK